MLEDIKNHLIVSCQALEYEPLHSSFIMSKMALAAYQGGAKGIRANTIEDIQAIKKKLIYLLLVLSNKNMKVALCLLHLR